MTESQTADTPLQTTVPDEKTQPESFSISLPPIPGSPALQRVDSADMEELEPPLRSPHRVLTSADLPTVPARPGEEKESDGPKKRSKDELRKECILEIYQTEKDYICDLELIIDVFIFPLRTMQVATEQILYSIFSNLEVLINCNKEMLKELEIVMDAKTGGEVEIGEVFTKLVSDYSLHPSVYLSIIKFC